MEQIKKLVSNQRTYFRHGNTTSYEFRKKQLETLKRMLKENESKIYRALKYDLNKPRQEAYMTEIGFLYMEIDFALKHLRQWMMPEKVSSPITHKGSTSLILKEPYGVAFIIAPWNYPIQLSFAPAIGAIAAGNCVIIKPSELAAATSSLIKELVSEYFDPSYFTVVEGAGETTKQVIDERVDYIFFTGSTRVAKKIMEAASKHLTPVTLECGGKSPAIVDSDANINLAAKRIVWGKFTNAGQTCVAPDYVYVHDKVKFKFVKAMKRYIRSFYGKENIRNTNFTKIINENHFDRLVSYLSCGTILHGGTFRKEDLWMEPTILDRITWEDAVMQEEIFGPILPVLTFTHLDDALYTIRNKEKPLALYYFGENSAIQQQVIEFMPFGGGAINDTLYHLANPHLPFGGVGSSGFGNYHGKYSFDTFSHQKSVLKQTTKFDMPFRYPGGKISDSIVKQIMK